MMGLSDGAKSFQIRLVVLIQYRLWQTATQPPSHPATHPASHVAVAITLYAKASSLMITSKRNSIVLSHFFGFNCHQYEMLMSAVLIVYATWHTANYVPIGTCLIYVPAEVMPASVFTCLCKLLYTKPMLTWNCSITWWTSMTEVHFRHRVP